MAGVPRNSNVGFQLEVSEGGTPDRASARLFDLRATMSADAGAIPPAQPSRPSLLSRLGTLLERVRTPPVTRSTVAVLAITFVVATSAEGAATNLALVPGKTVPMAWNLLTASWLETNPAALLLACVAAVVLGRLVEPAVGGGREFIRFLVFVTGFVGLSTFVASLLRFYATRDERSLYEPHHGFQGVLAGLLVAVKQHLGENPSSVRGKLATHKCKTASSRLPRRVRPRRNRHGTRARHPGLRTLRNVRRVALRAIPSTQTRRIRRPATPQIASPSVFPSGGGGGDGSVCRRRARVLLRRTRTSPRERVRHRVFTPGVRTREVRGRGGAVKGGRGHHRGWRRRRNGRRDARARAGDSRRSRGKRRRRRRQRRRREAVRGVVKMRCESFRSMRSRARSLV